MTTTQEPLVDILPKRKGGRQTLRWLPTPEDFPAEGRALPQAGFVTLSSARDETTYCVTESAETHGRCVLLRKVSGRGTDKDRDSYLVICDRDGTHGRCECAGWKRHGTCKHVDCIETLIANRWL
jgi:hypothetical protein